MRHFRSTSVTVPTVLFFVISFFVISIHGQSTSSGTSSSFNGTTSLPASTSSLSPTSSAAYPSLSGYSTCVTNCLQVAASNRGCTSIIQTNCYCNSTNITPFESDLISCTGKGCPNELATAESLAKAFCAVGNSSTAISFPPVTSSSSSFSSRSSSLSTLPSIQSSSSPSSSSSPTRSPNDAIRAHGELRGLTSNLLVGFCISLVSVLIGAFSV